MDNRLKSYLDAIDPAGLSYAEWVHVGMALKHEGEAVEAWDEWSGRDPSRYHAGECAKKWRTFQGGNMGADITGGTLYQMAVDHGWQPETEAVLYDFADEIDMAGAGTPPDAQPRRTAGPQPVTFVGGEVHGGLSTLPAAEQVKTYIETLFQPSECVGFVVRARKDEKKGKWVPMSGGVNNLTSEYILKEISKCKGDLSNVFGTVTEAGAWVRINPLNGKGGKDSNVSSYRYALVESDTLPMAKQWELYQRLQLPCAAIVSSGGKSIHAIVRVDARDYKDYLSRVDKLFSILRGEGVEIDNQNRNPSRLSRLPGILRGGRMQSLIAVRTGAKDWESWLKYVEEEIEKDDLGDFENCLEMATPKLKDELIPGILRKGHKMLIAGPSKAGKSFLLLEMAVCIAGGLPWLGLPVKKGRVLYVNLEIDPESFKARIFEMMKARKLDKKDSANLDVWNLRGKATPLDKLVPKLIRRARNREYAAVIIDPIYKILTGDENSASEMGAFTNQFDRICAALGCAVIYCHHHSKGAQAGKRAIDRASGSGVFARDPDALLDLMEIEKRPRDEARLREIGANAALVSGMKRRGFVARKPDGSIWGDAPANVYESQARCLLAEHYGNAAAERQRMDYPETLARAWEAWTGDGGERESGRFIVEEADRYAGFTAWVLEASAREFAPPKPRHMWFSYPLHVPIDANAEDELTQAFRDMTSGRRGRGPAGKGATANAMEEKKTPAEERADAAIEALQMEAAARRLDGREDADTFTREELLEVCNRAFDKPISKSTFIKWTVPGHEKSNVYFMRHLDLVENTAGKPTRYRLREDPRTLEEMKDFTAEDFQSG